MRIACDRLLRRGFFHYGAFVYRWRYSVVLVATAICLGLAPGIALYIRENTVNDHDYIFSPSDGPHVQELGAFNGYWPYDDSSYVPGSSFDKVDLVFVTVYPRLPGDNLLHYLDQVTEVENRLRGGIELETGGWDTFRNISETWGYQDICASYLGWCYFNADHIDWLKSDPKRNLVRWPVSRRVLIHPRDDCANLHIQGYQDSLLGKLVYTPLALSEVDFVGVYKSGWDEEEMWNLIRKLKRLNATTNFLTIDGKMAAAINAAADTGTETADRIQQVERIRNLTESQGAMGRFNVVSDIILNFFLKKGEKERSVIWKAEVEKVLKDLALPNVRAALYHQGTMSDALEDLQTKLTPKFALAFIIMAIFASLCSLVFMKRASDGVYVIDWVRSKPVLAVVGVVTAGMSVVSTIGLLMYAGFTFNSVVCVMPFMIFCNFQ